MSSTRGADARDENFRAVAAALLALSLAACATTPAPVRPAAPPAVRPATQTGEPARPEQPPHFEAPSPAPAPPVEAAPSRVRSLSSLPGWEGEDHAAALIAFQSGCGVARDARWREVCRRAHSLGPLPESSARAFFEVNFLAEAAPPPGLLTAYFAPDYPAQAAPDEIFSAPVRAKPIDNSSDTDGPGPTRAEIESDTDAAGVGAPRAFMKPEDLFFLQIQGSGSLGFPDGRRMRAVYSGDNGRPFTPIARPMVAAGLLAPGQASGDAIRAWLAAHRGAEADAVMDQNARYIYFDLIPDDGKEPAGAAGTPLTAGRALAVDPAYHGYGALYWIDASAPTLAGAAKTYRRLALALDTGAAIRGERRADLYLGRGDAAGQEAGRVRHVLSLVRLLPVTATPGINPSLSDPAHEAPPKLQYSWPAIAPTGRDPSVGGDRRHR